MGKTFGTPDAASKISTLKKLSRNDRVLSFRMGALTEIFFGNPFRRMANSWYNVYQHYEDYWRFRLNNPGANYRHHLQHKQFLAHQKKHLKSAQSRAGSESNVKPAISDLY